MSAVERVRAAYAAIDAAGRPEIWITLRPADDALAEAAAIDAQVAAGERLAAGRAGRRREGQHRRRRAAHHGGGPVLRLPAGPRRHGGRPAPGRRGRRDRQDEHGPVRDRPGRHPQPLRRGAGRLGPDADLRRVELRVRGGRRARPRRHRPRDRHGRLWPRPRRAERDNRREAHAGPDPLHRGRPGVPVAGLRVCVRPVAAPGPAGRRDHGRPGWHRPAVLAPGAESPVDPRQRGETPLSPPSPGEPANTAGPWASRQPGWGRSSGSPAVPGTTRRASRSRSPRNWTGWPAGGRRRSRRPSRGCGQPGCEVAPVDIAPLLEAATLLYGGSFVAERYAAVGAHIAAHEELIGHTLDPVVARIILDGAKHGAADYFADRERLDRLAARAAAALAGVRRAAHPDDDGAPDARRGRGGPGGRQLPAGPLHQLLQPARPRRAGDPRPEQSPGCRSASCSPARRAATTRWPRSPPATTRRTSSCSWSARTCPASR